MLLTKKERKKERKKAPENNIPSPYRGGVIIITAKIYTASYAKVEKRWRRSRSGGINRYEKKCPLKAIFSSAQWDTHKQTVSCDRCRTSERTLSKISG